MATKLITLKQAELFEVSTALAKAYRNTFSADTISRASQYVEGSKNPSRNYMWGIIMNTQGKAGKLCDIYTKETAQALCRLTLYKLAQPQAKSVSVDAF